MASRQPKLKTAYRPSARLEVFYTGGAACLSSQGLLACACSDEVKVRHTIYALALASPQCIIQNPCLGWLELE